MLCNVKQLFLLPTGPLLPDFLYTDHPNLKTTIYAERFPYKPSCNKKCQESSVFKWIECHLQFQFGNDQVKAVVKDSVKITRRMRFETFVCIDRNREIAPLTPNCRIEDLSRRLAGSAELSTSVLSCVATAQVHASETRGEEREGVALALVGVEVV